ncbi:MAG: hypothetical protein EOP32_32720 [Rhodococcus sp. (in: high G+C Gram-positive bacteria)]|nr:MAG: hypothetical protein EOP32_32720 [Rhodococcus sp. (in: high G+C Gram-positive bacteria)]
MLYIDETTAFIDFICTAATVGVLMAAMAVALAAGTVEDADRAGAAAAADAIITGAATVEPPGRPVQGRVADAVITGAATVAVPVAVTTAADIAAVAVIVGGRRLATTDTAWSPIAAVAVIATAESCTHEGDHLSPHPHITELLGHVDPRRPSWPRHPGFGAPLVECTRLLRSVPMGGRHAWFHDHRSFLAKPKAAVLQDQAGHVIPPA